MDEEKNKKKGKRKGRKSNSQGTLWYAAKFSLCAADEIAGVKGNCWQEESLQAEALPGCLH